MGSAKNSSSSSGLLAAVTLRVCGARLVRSAGGSSQFRLAGDDLRLKGEVVPPRLDGGSVREDRLVGDFISTGRVAISCLKWKEVIVRDGQAMALWILQRGWAKVKDWYHCL